MGITIGYVSEIAALSTNLLALLIGIFFCFRKTAAWYWRIIFGYLAISFTVEIFGNSHIGKLVGFHVAMADDPLIANSLYNIFTILEMLTFSWFLFQVVVSRLAKKIAIFLQIIFVATFILQFAEHGMDKTNGLAVLIEDLMCIVLCLSYFRELLFLSEPGLDLLTHPTFWAVIAIMFYFAGLDLLTHPTFWAVIAIMFYFAATFPLYWAKAYLDSHDMVTISDKLYSINNFALVVTYLLFIKGYTCRIKRS
jgi:hypothetical protein